MTIEPSLIGLLYRADWTRLSLSAGLSLRADYRQYEEQPSEIPGLVWRKPAHPVQQPGPSTRAGEITGSLLIAPGGRFRMHTVDPAGRIVVRGCDGDRSWQHFGQLAEGHQTRPFGRHPPLLPLLAPSWLLSGYQLTTEGAVSTGGRDGYRIVATPRPVIGKSTAGDGLADRVEAVVDAELGILLRCQKTLRGRFMSLDELREVKLEPSGAADPAQFAAPPGAIAEQFGALFSEPGWRAAKTAAGLGAAGLGFAIKLAARRPPRTPADAEAAMPRDEQENFGAGGPRHTRPISDELLSVLYRAGLTVPHFAAELHEWSDPAAIAERARSWAGTAGIPGLRVLADAIGERASTAHQVARLRVAALDRYRIDYVRGQGNRGPKTVACDGQHRWRVYHDRVAVGPAVPLRFEIAQLIDVAWLLGCDLAGSEVTVGGRRALRVSVTNPPPCPGPRPATVLLCPAEAVVDAELGIMLKLTSYAGDRPALRFELRDISCPSEQPPGDFRIDAAPGTRLVEDSGRLLDEVNAPEPVKVAARVAGQMTRQAAAGAAAVSSFLDGVRGRRPGRTRP